MCVYIYMWVKCFFIETSWSQFLFLVSYVFWSLKQLTFFNQSSGTLPWPDIADFLNWHLVSCAERHIQDPFTFQQTSGCFCFIRRPLAFSNSSNKHDLFRLAPKQTRRPVKTPGEKMWWKKKAKTARLYNMSAAETIETHAKALTDTQCSFPVRRYQQPQHEGLSQTRVCVIYN